MTLKELSELMIISGCLHDIAEKVYIKPDEIKKVQERLEKLLPKFEDDVSRVHK